MTDGAPSSSRETLVALTRRTLAHIEAGTVPLAETVEAVPASHYTDPQRWRAEIEGIFQRLPLVLGCSAELAEPGAYRAMEVAGVPILLTRSADGPVRGFVNACVHRGAIVVPDGSGVARRFRCPYHAWSYDTDGALVGILDRQDFGQLDAACHGLSPLAVTERAGLIFGLIDHTRAADDLEDLLDRHLCGYDAFIEHFGFARCVHVGSQRIDGPNWKLAYDGYLDFYHLPVLHRESFGPDIVNRAIYDAWGPHQRVSSPDPRLARLAERPVETWTDGDLTDGVWTIFPQCSIATFKVAVPGVDGGGRMHLLSALYPGDEPGTSVTVQHFLAGFEVTDELRPAIEAQQRFLLGVVRDEDYATGLGIQRALRTGARRQVLFGRNEAGGQRFHRWVDRLVGATTDAELRAVFDEADVSFQP